MNMVEKESGIFESFDKTPIYYEVRGQGEPLVLIYGIACLMNHWHHQMEYFSKHYKVITFDIRGHHKSQPLGNPQNLKISDIVQDMMGLMEHLNISKAHFGGHSFGAPLLLELFRQKPELVASMTFINGFSKNPIKGMFGLDVVEPFYYFVKEQYEKAPDLWTTLWRMTVDNPLSMLLAGAAGGFNLKLTHFKDIEVYARGVARMDLRTFIVLFEELMKFDGEDILPLVKIPTLIISGEKDNVTPQKFQYEFHQKISGSEFVLVPYGSHCTQLDFPDYINMKIEAFLKKNSA
ncbi:alpha/beta fold hydrolase [Bdellovibrio sp. HCB337]|uniref:alpha/beta fold hydrolase n=1 Tax=Bdellovibrio sp. HCB337 TaxID=3394358 RepID=UPI0039A44C85